ncbi:MAG: cupredoxin domain-containing protein [Thermoplasmatota archaeon]
MRRAPLTTACLVALAAVLAATAPAAAETVTVEIVQRDFRYVFEPAEVTIQAGDTIRFVHADTTGARHTVTSTDGRDDMTPNGLFDETLRNEGEVFAFDFTEAGTFHYYCKPHSNTMFGTINVREAAGDDHEPGNGDGDAGNTGGDGSPGDTGGSGGGATDGDGEDEGAPGLATPLLLLGIVAAAVAGRRRRF